MFPCHFQWHFSFPGRHSDYFLGEMSIPDTILGRNKRNIISPWTFSHSLLLFRGKVFEWGIRSGWRLNYYMDRRPSSCTIKWHWGSKGSSKCSLRDAEKWTREFGRKYRYSLLWNNCHHFVNHLVKYLSTNCGRWSTQNFLEWTFIFPTRLYSMLF